MRATGSVTLTSAISTFALALVAAAGGDQAVAAPQFELRADASLTRDAQVQRGGRFALQAEMSMQPQPSVAPAALAGGGYALSAVASPSSLVCYNDTIFRDDFDGDGF